MGVVKKEEIERLKATISDTNIDITQPMAANNFIIIFNHDEHKYELKISEDIKNFILTVINLLI